MGTAARRPLSAILPNPGPGAYEHEGKPRGNKYTLTGKKRYEHDEKVPGPGAYEPRDGLTKETGCEVKIGTGPKVGKDTSTVKIVPGPGAYAHKRPKTAGPSFGFGTGQRPKRRPNDNPGPGQYQIPDGIADVSGRGSSDK